MSLQVWLPLNGDLHNQGLKGLTATNNGATVNNNGKIGKCYQLGTAASDISLPAAAMNSCTTECSISFWIDILTWNTSYATFFQAGPAGTAWSTYVFGFLRNNAASTCCFTISNGSSASNANYLTPALDLNKWYHITLVYKTGHCLIYINGSLYRDYVTSIVPKFSNITTIKIGRSANGSSYQTNCLMNDFRIYNHALSAAEVAEIAKGLVLHYKLDELNSNLLTDLNDGWVIESGVTLTWDSNVNMYKISTNKTSTSRWGIYKNITLQANTTYTFSIDGMKGINNGTGAAFAEGATTSWPSSFASFTTTRERKSKTITIGDTDANCKIYLALTPSGGETTKYTYFALPKLEKSNFMTSWISNTANTNIIHDCSGYQNNGTVVSELSAAADTPKYETSTQFSGTNYFKRVSPSSEIKTISLWVKWNSIPSGQSVIYVDYKSKTGFGLMSTGILCSSCGLSSYTFDKTSIVANTWYHFVIVSPNGASNATRKLYINGIEQIPKTTTSNWTYSIDELQIGKRSTTSDGFNGKISDFRMYSIVLSDQQIKELYNTSASIDASGNIYARELKEV